MIHVSVELDWIDQRDLHWLDGGKNWMATVSWNPDNPGGLNREFWNSKPQAFRAVPDELGVGDFIEVAADDTRKRRMGINRRYFRVAASLAENLSLVECRKPKKKELTVDEFVAQLNGLELNPLMAYSDEDLVAEVRRRGLVL